MSKITQKELLQEGFLDVIRASGRALGKGAVKAAGATVGGAIGGIGKAALQVGKDIITGNTGATLSNVAKQGIEGVKSGGQLGSTAASKALEAITGKEEAALRKDLETNYKNVFQPISLNIRRGQPDPTNTNITIIPFTARRIGDPTILKTDSNIATGKTLSVDPASTLLQNPGIAKIVNAALGTEFAQGIKQPKSATLGLDTQETGEIKGRFMSPLTQFLTNLKNSKQGLFLGYVKKTGNVKDPYQITVRDIQGKEITGNKKENIKPPIPKYDELIKPFLVRISNSNSPKLIDYSKAVAKAFNLSAQSLKDLVNDSSVKTVAEALSLITNKKPEDTLTLDDIDLIKKTFKDSLIAESSQINLIKQLKLLNDSYNKTYELSKH
jgi:hypothetical protein